MQAPVQQQRQGRSLGAVMKDKEEDLALFLEMRKREKERNSLILLHISEDFDPPLGSKPGVSPIFMIVSSTPRNTASDDFLSSDSEKNDYDWLLTPPGTPLFSFSGNGVKQVHPGSDCNPQSSSNCTEV